MHSRGTFGLSFISRTTMALQGVIFLTLVLRTIDNTEQGFWGKADFAGGLTVPAMTQLIFCPQSPSFGFSVVNQGYI